MAKHKLKVRILTTTFTMVFSFMAVLTAIFIGALVVMDRLSLRNAEMLGNTAAAISTKTLEEQVKPQTIKLAQDTAIIIEDKLLKMENIARLLAETASDIYENSSLYRARRLPYIGGGDVPAEGLLPFMHTAPGINFQRIRTEGELIANCADAMQLAGAIGVDIASAFVAGESGYILEMESMPLPAQDYNPKQRHWYVAAQNAGVLSWTEFYIDMRDQRVLLACAAPIYDTSSGERLLKGVAGCSIAADSIDEIIQDADIWTGHNNTFVFILDKTGKKIFGSNKNSVRKDEDQNLLYENYLENLQYKAAAQKMLSGESGFYTLIDGDQIDYVAYHPLSRFNSSLGWSVGIYFDGSNIIEQMDILKTKVSEITAKSQKETTNTATMMIIVIAVVGVAMITMTIISIFHFAGKVTQPIVELSDAVEMISNGNLDGVQVVSSEIEELDRLAFSFNNMIWRLKAFIKNLARVTAERERLSSVLHVAAEIQDTMLPHKFPVTSGKKHSYDLYAMMHSAEEVGGDFYDFFLVDKNRLAIVIGDVSGVGLAAAIFMVVTKTLIHAWLKHGMPLDTAIMETNKQLYENNSRGIFVTVWAGMLDLHTGKLQFITAGQNPPLMKTGGKNFGVLATANDPPLGFAESPEYRIKQTLLQKDDTLFLYTDGVVNAFDNDGEQYGIDRLRDLMDNNSNMTMHELLTLIRKEVQTFSGGHPQADDLTMLGLRLC